MALAYHKKDDLENAKKFYEKSLTEHRTPETRSKLSDVEKAIKEKEKKAYINPEKSLEEKTKGNEYFTKGISCVLPYLDLVTIKLSEL